MLRYVIRAIYLIKKAKTSYNLEWVLILKCDQTLFHKCRGKLLRNYRIHKFPCIQKISHALFQTQTKRQTKNTDFQWSNTSTRKCYLRIIKRIQSSSILKFETVNRTKIASTQKVCTSYKHRPVCLANKPWLFF